MQTESAATTKPTTRRNLGLLMAVAGLVAHGASHAEGMFDEGDHPARGPGGPDRHQALDPQRAAEMSQRMMERRTSHMLDAVDATPEQRSKIMAIARATHKDLSPLREQQRSSKQKGRELMFAANLDRTAIERQRQDQLKLRDGMGQRMLNGMLDALSVLTAEQRAKLGSRASGMHGMRGMGERMQHMRERMGRPGMMPK
jgi:Spy/CpxP family protein refolding chaperone